MNALLILILQFPVLRLTQRFSPLKLLVVSNILFSLSLLLVSRSSSWGIYLAMVLFLSLGEVLLGSNFDYSVDGFSAMEDKGFYFGLSEMVRIGNTVGPIVGGMLIEKFTTAHFNEVFLLLGLITLLGQLFLSFYGKFRKTAQ